VAAARRAGARLALAGLVASGLAIAVGAAGAPSPALTPSSRDAFPGWFAGPLAPLASGSLDEGGFWVLVVAMVVSYVGALALAREIGPRLALSAVVALHVVFLLAPPLLTTDPFGYLAYARLGALEGVSPYLSGAEALPEADPVRPFVIWHAAPSPYGPLFTVASLALAPLGVAAGLWALKAGAVVASLAGIALVWRLAPRLGREPVLAVLFVGLNPVLLVWAVGGAHNDIVMAALLLGAVALSIEGRAGAGGALAGAAAGIKISAGLVLAPLLVGARARRRALAGALAGLAGGALLALALLGLDGLDGYPAALREQGRLVSESSPIQVIGTALGLGGATAGMRLAAAAVLVVTLTAVCLRLARTPPGRQRERALVAACGWTVLAGLATTAWLMPWYVVWLLPFAALAPGRSLRISALALCAFVVVARLPGPPL
jgi:hypothetical protein